MGFGHEKPDVYLTNFEYIGWPFRLYERTKSNRNAN